MSCVSVAMIWSDGPTLRWHTEHWDNLSIFPPKWGRTFGSKKKDWKIMWFFNQTRFSDVDHFVVISFIHSFWEVPQHMIMIMSYHFLYQVDFEISKKKLHPWDVPYGGMFLEVKNPKNRTPKVIFHPNTIFKSHHFVVQILKHLYIHSSRQTIGPRDTIYVTYY